MFDNELEISKFKLIEITKYTHNDKGEIIIEEKTRQNSEKDIKDSLYRNRIRYIRNKTGQVIEQIDEYLDDENKYIFEKREILKYDSNLNKVYSYLKYAGAPSPMITLYNYDNSNRVYREYSYRSLFDYCGCTDYY